MVEIHRQWLGSRFDDDPDWYKLGALVSVDASSPDVVVIDFPNLGMSVAYAVLPDQTADQVRQAFWLDRGNQAEAARFAGL